MALVELDRFEATQNSPDFDSPELTLVEGSFFKQDPEAYLEPQPDYVQPRLGQAGADYLGRFTTRFVAEYADLLGDDRQGRIVNGTGEQFGFLDGVGIGPHDIVAVDLVDPDTSQWRVMINRVRSSRRVAIVDRFEKDEDGNSISRMVDILERVGAEIVEVSDDLANTNEGTATYKNTQGIETGREAVSVACNTAVLLSSIMRSELWIKEVAKRRAVQAGAETQTLEILNDLEVTFDPEVGVQRADLEVALARARPFGLKQKIQGLLKEDRWRNAGKFQVI